MASRRCVVNYAKSVEECSQLCVPYVVNYTYDRLLNYLYVSICYVVELRYYFKEILVNAFSRTITVSSCPRPVDLM